MSKIKKILCVVLLIVMCIPQASFAVDTTTYAINENFNNSTGTLTSNVDNWKSITFSGTGLDNGLTFTGNEVKDAEVSIDTHPVKGNKSLKYSVTSNRLGLYVNQSGDASFGQYVNFEFSFMAESTSQTAVQISAKNSSGTAWGSSIITVRDGKIYLNYKDAKNVGRDTKVTYEEGKWYHVVFSFNTKANSDSKYECKMYINNEEISIDPIGAQIYYNSMKEMKLMISPEANTSVWLDDVKVYSPSAFGYTPSDDRKCSVAAKSAGYTVDDATDTVSVPKGATFNDVISGLTIDGTPAFYNTTYTAINSENYGNAVAAGTKLVVRSADGAVVKEYTVTVVDTTTYAINENFNNSTGTLTSNVDPGNSITFSGNGLSNNLTFTSDKVNDAVVSVDTHLVKGGKSLKYSVTSNRVGLYINRSETTALRGNINFEFSFMAENINQTAVQITAKDSSSNQWAMIANNSFLVARDGKIYLNYQNANNKGKELASYEAGKWYHAVFCVDTATASYMLYLNNEEVFSKTTTENSLIRSDLKELKLMISPEANSSVWLDDVKVYSPSAFGYTPYDDRKCSVAAKSAGYTVDDATDTVSVPQGATFNDVISGLTIVGNKAFYTSDYTAIDSVNYGNAVAAGTKLVVRSIDGAVVKEYTVVEVGDIVKRIEGTTTIVSLPVAAGNTTKNVRLLVGVYNGTTLEKVYMSEKSSVTGTEDVTVTITDNLTGKTLKAFAWESLTTLVPLKGVSPLD